MAGGIGVSTNTNALDQVTAPASTTTSSTASGTYPGTAGGTLGTAVAKSTSISASSGKSVAIAIGAGLLLGGTSVAPLVLGILAIALIFQTSLLLEGK